MSQLSFTCSCDPEACKYNPRTALPFLYSEGCLALFGNKVSSATWLCRSYKGSSTAPGRGAGETKQQEQVFCQLLAAAWAAWAASCQLGEVGPLSGHEQGPLLLTADGEGSRQPAASRAPLKQECSAACAACLAEENLCPSLGSFSVRFVWAYLYLQCNIC